MGEKIVSVKRLSTGYVHIRGRGPCEWAQPPAWPTDPETLEASFFPEASADFRRAVRAANERLADQPV